MTGKQVVPLEEVMLAQAFEFAPLLTVLERRGLLTRGEVGDEIGRPHGGTQTARCCLVGEQDRSPRPGEGFGLGSDKGTQCSWR